MAGHMGAVQVTSKNLRVIAKDEAKGLLLIEGAVPGATNGTSACGARRSQQQEAHEDETDRTRHRRQRSRDASRWMTPCSASSRTSPSCTRRSSPRWRNEARRQRQHEDARRGLGLDAQDPQPEGHAAVAPGQRSARRSTATAASSTGRGRAATRRTCRSRCAGSRSARCSRRRRPMARCASCRISAIDDAEHEGDGRRAQGARCSSARCSS